MDDPHVICPVVPGARIRALRRRLDLTLDQVGRAAGISKPFLSQIERGRATPSISSLTRIANALGVTLHYLIESRAGGRSVRRASDALSASRKESSVTFSSLSGTGMNQGLDAIMVRLPGGNTCVTASTQPEDGLFIHVLDGELVVGADVDSLILGIGDSVSYEVGGSLYLRNASDREAVVLCVGKSKISCNTL